MTTLAVLLVLAEHSTSPLPFQDPTQIIAVISGLVLPLLVGVVTKMWASGGLKATVLLVLTAASQVINTAYTPGHGWTWELFFWNFFLAFLTAITLHLGLYRPTGVSDTVQVKTRNFGIGNPPAPEMETDEKGQAPA